MSKYNLKYSYIALMYNYMSKNAIYKDDDLWDCIIFNYLIGYTKESAQDYVNQFVNCPDLDHVTVNDKGEKGAHEMVQKVSSVSPDEQDSSDIETLAHSVARIRINNIVNELLNYANQGQYEGSYNHLNDSCFDLASRASWYNIIYNYMQEAEIHDGEHMNPIDYKTIDNNLLAKSFNKLNVKGVRIDEDYTARKLTNNHGDLCVTPQYKRALADHINHKVYLAQLNYTYKADALKPSLLYGYLQDEHLHLVVRYNNGRLGLPRNARKLLDIGAIQRGYIADHPEIVDLIWDTYKPTEKETMEKINKNIKDYVINK